MEYRICQRRAFVRFENEADFNRVNAALSAKHPAAQILKKQNRRNPFYQNWDGKIHMLKPNCWRRNCEYEIPLGLLVKASNELGLEPPEFEPPFRTEFKQLLNGKTLDNDQVAVCQTLLSKSLVSAQFKTGSGKTEVMINACLCLLDQHQDVKIVVLVPLKRLLDQTYSRFVSAMPKGLVGRCGDGHKDVDSRVIIGIPNTVASLQIEDVTHVIADEAHHSSSALWEKAVAACNPSSLWGLSGKLAFTRSVNKQKELELEGILGPLLIDSESAVRRVPVDLTSYRVDSKIVSGLPTQITDGVTCAFKYLNEASWSYGKYVGLDSDRKPNKLLLTEVNGKVKIDKSRYGVYVKGKQVKPSEIEPNTLVYRIAYDVAAQENADVNKWAIELARSFDDPWLMTVQKVRHLILLKNLAEANGLRVVTIYSGTGPSEAEIKTGLADGTIDGIIATAGSISEGVDIPALVHLIKLDRMSGEQLLTQQHGRMVRAFPGKGMGHIHIPDDDHCEGLKRVAGKIRQFYRDMGVKVIRAK